MGNIIQANQPCPNCPSSDAYQVYADGGHCFSCGKSTKTDAPPWDTVKETKMEQETKVMKGDYLPMPDRKIKQPTTKFYGVTQTGGDHHYPYYDSKGELKAIKHRSPDKKFQCSGGTGGMLFGMNKFNSGGKILTITEGELDAMSAYQMQGSKYPVISVPSSSDAEKAVKANYKWVDNFEAIHLAFDDDKPGQDAARKVASLFEPGKAKLCKFDADSGLKDASDYLTKGKEDAFRMAFWNAEPHKPQAIHNMRDLWDKMQAKKKVTSVPYPWDGLNKMTYGHRLGELVGIKAPPKVGKTQFCREVAYALLGDTQDNIACMFLEEPNEDTLQGLMALHLNKRIMLPDVETNMEEEKDAFDYVAGQGRYYTYDGFGSRDIDEIIRHIRYFVKALGCRYVFLDHISILVSDGRNNDERKAIDEVATKLKSLTIELGCAIFVVSHVNDDGKFRSSRALQQLSNIVLSLERDKMADGDLKHQTKLFVEDNRFCGDTGLACILTYDPETGRLSEGQPDEDFDNV